MRRTRMYILLVAVSLFVLLVTGCAAQAPEETAAPTAAPTTVPPTTLPPVIYTVTYEAEGIVTQVEVQEGLLPEVPGDAPEGKRICGWLDADGEEANPAQTPIFEDTAYTAVIYPQLRHVPYLFVDGDGFLNPEEILTGKDLAAAMAALAPYEGYLETLTMPSGGESITAEILRPVLTGSFTEAELDAAFAEREGELTRVQFAQVMNTLLGRSEETLSVTDPQTIPKDLDLNGEWAADLLEAYLTHEPSELGYTMMEAVYEMPWTPGYHYACGYTYYADENGRLLRDEMLGTLYYGPDGRYTCGDAELDLQVAEILYDIIKDDPNRDRSDWLYDAFEYSRDSFFYAGKLILDIGATGWEVEVAKEMLQNGYGNCYHYAAVYCVLAWGLGYEAEGISGLAMALVEPHGWVAMEFDGETFVYDPQTAMCEMIGRRTNWGEDMYKVPDWDWDAWLYVWPEEILGA